MRRKTYFMSMLLLMAGVFFSCDNKDSEEPELENHMMVNESEILLEGMVVSYNTSSSAVADGKARGSYPLEIHLYESKPYFKSADGGGFKMVEDSAPMIQLSLYTTENGVPEAGDYIWKMNGTDAGTCTSAWQSTKYVEHRSMDGNALVAKYELVSISITSLIVTKVADRIYEFAFEGIDYNGATISGYYKGGISLTRVFGEDETK